MRLVQNLLLAKKELRLIRSLRKLAWYQAQVIDDLGYIQQSREEMEELFTVLAERYERGIRADLLEPAVLEMGGHLQDSMTTAAAIDRLVHHSVILELNVPSYRMEQAKKNEAENGMKRRPIRKRSCLTWRLGLQTSGIYGFSCYPRRSRQDISSALPDLVILLL